MGRHSSWAPILAVFANPKGKDILKLPVCGYCLNQLTGDPDKPTTAFIFSIRGLLHSHRSASLPLWSLSFLSQAPIRTVYLRGIMVETMVIRSMMTAVMPAKILNSYQPHHCIQIMSTKKPIKTITNRVGRGIIRLQHSSMPSGHLPQLSELATFTTIQSTTAGYLTIYLNRSLSNNIATTMSLAISRRLQHITAMRTSSKIQATHPPAGILKKTYRH